MAQQMIKGMTMLLLVLALSLVTAVVSANGQSSNRQVANIPFDFVVGDKELPAGRYSTQGFNSTGETLRITGLDTTASAIRLSSTLQTMDDVNRGKLVFHRYGNQYFLADIWTAGSRTGRHLLKSSGEKAVEREVIGSNRRPSQNYERVEIALFRQ